MRSSSFRKVESSALIARGGIERGAVDVGEGARPTEGLARSEEKTHHPETGSGELGLSVRWVRALLVRLRTRGDAGLRHGLRGRQSNRRTPETVKRRVVGLYRQKKRVKLWHDYGPTLALEELAEQHGIAISRETLRKWLIEAKLWRARRARVEQAHLWRARRARYGELVQWDAAKSYV